MPGVAITSPFGARREPGRIAIVGILRNCERELASEVERLARAVAPLAAPSWFLVESDSEDGTNGELVQLSRSRPDFRYVSLGSLRSTIPMRTARIAQCRNRYLEELATHPSYADVRHVVVADFGGTNDLVTAQGIASCFARDDWGACTANQRGPYYDIWALRHALWSPNDCWAHYRFLEAIDVEPEDCLRASVHTRMIEIPEERDWIEVESAFGGLAIYERTALLAGRYRGTTEDGEEVCEHVPFNARVRAAGHRIFVNPRLINTGVTDHTRELRTLRRIRRRIGQASRRLRISRKVAGVGSAASPE